LLLPALPVAAGVGVIETRELGQCVPGGLSPARHGCCRQWQRRVGARSCVASPALSVDGYQGGQEDRSTGRMMRSARPIECCCVLRRSVRRSYVLSRTCEYVVILVLYGVHTGSTSSWLEESWHGLCRSWICWILVPFWPFDRAHRFLLLFGFVRLEVKEQASNRVPHQECSST
jgi:hypothetical protein